MKAIIVTIYDHYNLGNRLQNYGVQKTLENLGLDVETIQFRPFSLTNGTWIKYWIQRIFKFRLPGNINYWRLYIPRIRRFHVFNLKYIKTKYIKDVSKVDPEDADYWIVGSDQVWNVGWYIEPEVEKKMYFLTFAEKHHKVSFAASFGVEAIPEEWNGWVKEQLKTFKAVSVREDAGAKIVKSITGNDAEVLVDPTLMLDAKEWLCLAQPISGLDCSKSYMLTYFLGERTATINNDIQKFACENNLTVYNLLDEQQPEVYDVGPSEFIYLVSNASLILTDSFHACVFAFLFKKPFLVYRRAGIDVNMMSRLETFLGKFGLERKYKESGLDNNLFDADYDSGYEKLKLEREKTITFLKKAMDIKIVD